MPKYFISSSESQKLGAGVDELSELISKADADSASCQDKADAPLSGDLVQNERSQNDDSIPGKLEHHPLIATSDEFGKFLDTFTQLGIDVKALADESRYHFQKFVEKEEELPKAQETKVPKAPNALESVPEIRYTAELYSYDRQGKPERLKIATIRRACPIRTKLCGRVDSVTKPALDEEESNGKLLERVDSAIKPALDEGESNGEPIFEVRRYLGIPRRNKRRSKRRLVSDRHRYLNSDDSSASDVDPEAEDFGDPIEIEQDGGTVLIIAPGAIPDAIEKIAGHFPGTLFDGEGMIVAEPFCALVQFRDELLRYRDPSRSTSDGVIADVNEQHAYLNTTESTSEQDAAYERETGLYQIQKLFSYLDKHCKSAVLREKDRWAREVPKCTFEWLWLLFPPKTLVYQKLSAGTTVMRAYEVTSFFLGGMFLYDKDDRPLVHPRRLRARDMSTFTQQIAAIHIQTVFRVHEGRNWVLIPKTFVIHPFKGEKSITDLVIYPTKFYNDQDGKVRTGLIERGRRYRAFASRGQAAYSGYSLSGVRRQVESRIIIDPETFFHDPELAGRRGVDESAYEDLFDNSPDVDDSDHDQQSALPRTSRGWESGSDSSDSSIGRRSRRYKGNRKEFSKSFTSTHKSKTMSLSATRELSDEQYIICAPEIQAYTLKDRVWLLLAVKSVSDCVYQRELIDELQISKEARRLVQALSHNYATQSNNSGVVSSLDRSDNRNWSSDFIPSKGGGQIILLHGNPGVGKTTTAECIAELTQRPLLRITCGDLGDTATQIQRELTRWLSLGTLWNAVVLFDEADVFLERRGVGDIERNSIVSVFLRVLEYYQGLMFLTTNRVGIFDEAILSRIHVVLYLPNLSDDDRMKIWNTSFDKLRERGNIQISSTLTAYALFGPDIKNLNWNGREIRNAFNTMIALAEWDAQNNNKYTEDGKVEVKLEHLKEVAEMSKAFKKHLTDVRGSSEDDYMRSAGVR